MIPRLGRVAMATLVLLLIVGALHQVFARQTASANTVDIGVIAGAPYYIEIPVKWNKGLILYTHGYTPEGSQAAAVHVAAAQGIS